MDKKMGKKKQQISLCMIVKDEESSLGRCLESIKDEVDEIIIVDTGSRDRTVEIARQYTDKIYFHPWENSFSKARNYSLKYATSDWIFILDADEELEGGSIGLIRKSIKDEYADAFNVGTKSFVNKGKGLTFHKTPRLFRNNGIIHYEGIVHNQVVGYKSLKNSDIIVLHHGYNVDHGTRTKKFNRTKALLYEQIKQNPADPNPFINLSNSFISMKLYEDALKASSKAIELMRAQNRYPNLGSVAYYNRSICYFNQNDFKNMVAAGLECQRNYPDDIDSCVILIFGYRGLQKWDHVIQWGNIFLDKVQRLNEVGSRVVMSLSDLWKAHLFVGEAYMHREGRKEAVNYFNRSLSSSSQRETSLNAIIRILINQEWLKEAIPFVNLAIKEDICHEAVDIYKNKSKDHFRGIKIERPNISLCMIVKNESDCIGRCLESVRSLVDEMVIVDTGSIDNTIDIAREYGANIHEYKWHDDFSAARNYALSKVKEEWILIMDADEVIAGKDIGRIQYLIKSEKADAYRFTLRNYVSDVNLANVILNQKDYEEGLEYPGYIPASLIRLFRADPQIRFAGFVHETLDAAIAEKGKRVLDSGIPIHHYGKVMADRVGRKQDIYLKLGKEKIRENPHDPIAYKGLSDQHLELGMPDKALEVLNQGLALFPDMVELHFNRGLALDRLNRPDEARNEYLWVVERKPDHLGACHNLGQIYFNENQIDKAIDVLNRGIDLGLRHPAVFVLLGRAYNTIGKWDDALTSFDRVLEIQPNCPDVNCYKAVIFLNGNMYDAALNALEKEIEIGGNLVGAYNLLGQMSHERKDLKSAAQFFQKVLTIKPDDLTAKKHLENICLTQRRSSTISRSCGVNKGAKTKKS